MGVVIVVMYVSVRLRGVLAVMRVVRVVRVAGGSVYGFVARSAVGRIWGLV